MFSSLKAFSLTRGSWALLLGATITFELCALFFQHVLKLEPCVMCIYERVAMWGISLAAFVGLISPQKGLFRWLGLTLWLGASIKGLLLALQHVEYQMHPSPFFTCDIFVQFPSWAPINHWIPWMFEAYGDCSDIVWQFLTLSMPQWLVIIFAANIAFSSIFLLVQPIKYRQ